MLVALSCLLTTASAMNPPFIKACGTPGAGPGLLLRDDQALARVWLGGAQIVMCTVDGVRGLKLELKCREQLLSGKLSIAEARRHFFSYFDGVYSTVRQRQTRRFAEWCAACKQVPPGGL